LVFGTRNGSQASFLKIKGPVAGHDVRSMIIAASLKIHTRIPWADQDAVGTKINPKRTDY